LSEWLTRFFKSKNQQYFSILNVFEVHCSEDTNIVSAEQRMSEFGRRWGNFDPNTCRKIITSYVGEDDRCIAMWLLAFQQAYTLGEVVPFLASSSVKERWTSAFILGERRDERALPMLRRMLTEFLPSYDQMGPKLAYWVECRREWVPILLRGWLQPEIAGALRATLNICYSYHPLEGTTLDTLYWYEDGIAFELGYRDKAAALVGINTSDIILSVAMIQVAMGTYARCHPELNYYDLKRALLRTKRWIVSDLQEQLIDIFGLSRSEATQIIEDDFNAQRKGRERNEWDKTCDEDIELPPFTQEYTQEYKEEDEVVRDETLDYYQSLKPGRFVSLDKIIIRHDPPPEGVLSYVIVELKLSGQKIEDGLLHLRFYGVLDLHMDFSYEYMPIGYIEITSVANWHWEYRRYAVRATEGVAFHFYCHSFEVSTDFATTGDAYNGG
jgi:hypothetical protein